MYVFRALVSLGAWIALLLSLAAHDVAAFALPRPSEWKPVSVRERAALPPLAADSTTVETAAAAGKRRKNSSSRRRRRRGSSPAVGLPLTRSLSHGARNPPPALQDGVVVSITRAAAPATTTAAADDGSNSRRGGNALPPLPQPQTNTGAEGEGEGGRSSSSTGRRVFFQPRMWKRSGSTGCCSGNSSSLSIGVSCSGCII